ncbi:MAG TPA: ABC transporter ATP-binding protein [Acidimicrobiales bacterium]|nr:ABC transporter ATP-binding protein [Acidimicrobiales bacterium]
MAGEPRRGIIGALRRRWEASAPPRALLGYLPQVDRRGTIALAVLVLLLGVLPVAFAVTSGMLIGAVPDAVEGGPGSAGADRLLRLLLLSGAAFTAIQVLGPFRLRAVWNLGWSVEIGLQQRVIAASTGPVGIAHLEDPRTLDRIAVARGIDHEWLGPTTAIEAMANIASRYLVGMGSVLVLSTWHWWFGPLVASMYVISGSRLRTGFRAVVETMYVATPSFRRANYYRDLAIEPVAAKETRIFDLGGWLRERYRESWLAAMTDVWETRKRFRAAFMVLMTMTILAKGGAFLYIGLSGARGEITLATAAVLLRAVNGLADGFGAIGDDSVKIAQGSLGVPAALSLERETATNLQVDAHGIRDAAGLPGSAITFDGVTFAYPGSDLPLFDGLDLTIEAGRSLAVVGVNGAGKTTLVKLLARLYDPQGGAITVDGIDLRELDARSWQRRIAAIFQDFVRYELPVTDNVGFGAIDLLHDRDALQRAADRAGAASVIDGLPAGWDTVLSRQYEGGSDISGGEWQRIALARALLAVEGGAGVLVLDEPTANLDVRSEARVYDSFLELTRGLTSIVISHRFSTVRRADRIVVLEHGRVVEDGTHDQLVALGGRYATMYELQASRFADEDDHGDEVVDLVEVETVAHE